MRAALLVSQAMVERGMLDAMVAGVASARDRLEPYVGQGNAGYVLIGVAVLALVLLLRR